MIWFLSSTAFAGPTWTALQQSQGWTEIATRSHGQVGEVQVLQRNVGGVDCFQGRASVDDVKPEVLLEVVMDTPGSVRWSSAGIKEGEILGRKGPTVDYFQLLDVPGWTMSSDRFWFLRGNIEQGGDSLAFHWDRLVDGGPYKQRYDAVKAQNAEAIEPPINVGGWSFTNGGQTTKIEYTICSDTGGAIPQKLQSMATKKTLPDTLADVVTEARRRLAG